MLFEIADDEMSVRLQGDAESQREQIVNWSRLVGTEQQYIQLYLVPDDGEPWKKTAPDELIQATGRDGRMTVELYRLEGDQIRAYVVGRSGGDDELAESVFNGGNEYKVRPGEVWSPDEMTDLLLQYRDSEGVLATDRLSLREQKEFRRVIEGPTNAGNSPVASRPGATESKASESTAAESTATGANPAAVSQAGEADSVAGEKVRRPAT